MLRAKIPALDGLRAIAIIAVIAYHLDLVQAPGGFLGVDVFFVLSGYLITWILVTQVQERGRVDFARFYDGRWRRLVPAFAAVVFAVCVVASLCAPDTIPKFFSDLPWASTGTVNWWYVINETSYFEETARPPLLQHMWSLAVEAQFYFVWPIIVAFFARRSWLRGMRWFAVSMATTFAVMAISLGLHIEQASAVQASNFYFGTGSRCVGLLIGAALAASWTPNRLTANVPPRARLFIDYVAVAGLASLAYLFAAVDEVTLHWFAWGSPLASLVAVITLAALVHPGSRVSRLLSMRWLQWIGTRSYGLYLWHWPVFQLLRPGVDVAWPDVATNVVRLAVTAVVAEASYRWIETPVRQHRNPFAPLLDSYRNPRVRRFVAASLAAILIYPALALSRDAYATAKVEQAGFLAQLEQDAGSPREKPAGSPVPRVSTSEAASSTASRDPHFAPSPLIHVKTPVASPPESESTQPEPTAVPTSRAPFPGKTESTSPSPSAIESRPASTTPSATTSARTALTLARRQGVWVAGDSVLVGAMRELRKALPVSRNDAEVGMQANVLFHTLRDAADVVGNEVVIINIGNNGAVREKTLRHLLTAVNDRTVVLVDAVVPRRWQEPNNRLVREVLSDYPNVRLVQWSRIASGHPDYFGHDGIHLTATGAQRYVDAIVDALAAR